MKIITAYPPNFSVLAKRFPIKGKQGILYAWGDRIYNPSGITIPPWLKAHEGVHGERQGGMCDMGLCWTTPAVWWDLYIHDAEFRLREEVLAHRVEWEAYPREVSIENHQKYLDQMAERLSGPIYGDLISKREAIEMIQGRMEPNGETNETNRNNPRPC